MSATIDDVAKHAGVSTATVSRYLNNSPIIAQKSIDRVRRSIEELNYQPNSVARSLANKNTSTVAFIVDSTEVETYGDNYFLKIQYGIEAALGRQGYYLLIINAQKNKKGENDIKKLVLEKRTEGIILMLEFASKSMISILKKEKIPFVIIGNSEQTNVNFVDINNKMGGKIAAKALINNGSKRIAFLTSSFDKSFVRDRFEGYKTALLENSINMDEKCVVTGCITHFDGIEAVRNIHSSGLKIDGYVCTDNIVAFGVAAQLKREGINVPGNIQIVSFDNTVISELAEPQLSVVNIDVFQLGKQAANTLLSQFESPGTAVQNTLLNVSMVNRGSTR